MHSTRAESTPQTVTEQDSAALWGPQHKRCAADQRGIESISRAVKQLLVNDFVTTAQRNDIWELHSYCTSVSDIATRLRLSESDVRRVIAEGRGR